MLKGTIEYVNAENLISETDKVLVAISGGVDSVVLAYLLHKMQVAIGLAHCNFLLRGNESDGEEQLVRTIASEYHVEIHTVTFETKEFAAANGVSIQMAARNLRYRWFNEMVSSGKYNKVAIGHHQDDQVETLLLNLVRGSGVSGLKGMTAQRDSFIRPLLWARKSQISDYAKKEGLKWKEDSSNQENKYKRNLIRHEVLPLLKTINPAITETLARTADHMLQAHRVLSEEMLKIERKAVSEQHTDMVIHLPDIQPADRTEIFLASYLPKFGFNQNQISSIIHQPDKPGRLFYSATHRLNVDRHKLIISTLEGNVEDYEITSDLDWLKTAYSILEINKFSRSGYVIKPDSNIAALDLDLIRYPIRIRNWKKGDHFVPLGMSGKKKLSDFMIDRKIPLNLKQRQLVLLSEDQIIWVPGQQISEIFKITEQTSRVLEIKWLPKHD